MSRKAPYEDTGPREVKINVFNVFQPTGCCQNTNIESVYTVKPLSLTFSYTFTQLSKEQEGNSNVPMRTRALGRLKLMCLATCCRTLTSST